MTPAASEPPTDTIEALTKVVVDFSSVREWQQFHSAKNLTMALAGEVGELSSLLQWVDCNAVDEWIEAHRAELSGELADVAIYLLLLARRADVDLAAAVLDKVALNEQRYPAATARGTHTKYNLL